MTSVSNSGMTDEQNRWFYIIVAILICLSAAVTIPLLKKANDDEKQPGIYAYKAGHYDLAIQELSAYEQQHPVRKEKDLLTGKSYRSYHYLGLAYLKTHRYNEAIQVFSYFGNAEAFYNIGRAHEGEENYTQARADFNKSMQMEHENSNYKNIDLALIANCQRHIAEIDNITASKTRPAQAASAGETK